MSKRFEIEEHLRTLNEISGILGAMKNLALMETHKLSRFLSTQRRVVSGMESVAADFFSFYPDMLGGFGKAKRVFLVIGSERGFCGDFNEALLRAMEEHLRNAFVEAPILIAVGRKLSTRMEGDARVAACLEGPAVAEEVQSVLIRLMDALREVQEQVEPLCLLDLTILHHNPEANGARIQARQPFHQLRQEKMQFAHPPLLTLDPRSFMTDLINQYLYAILHEVFYSSLMAENHRRYQHMDQAVHTLEQDIAELALKRNTLRQEEITEEIEVIMLSVEALRRR